MIIHQVLNVFALLVYKNIRESEKFLDPESKRIIAKATRVFRLNRFTRKSQLLDSWLVVYKEDNCQLFATNELTDRNELMNILDLYS